MIQGYRVYDADAHVKFSPAMWETLPQEYVAKRPRPLRVSDEAGIKWTDGRLIDGRMEPHQIFVSIVSRMNAEDT